MSGTNPKKEPSDGVAALRPVRKEANETAKRLLEKIKSNPNMPAVRVPK